MNQSQKRKNISCVDCFEWCATQNYNHKAINNFSSFYHHPIYIWLSKSKSVKIKGKVQLLCIKS